MSPARVRLPAAVRAAIVQHARREAPRECCGFLIGSGRRIQFALPLANVDSRPESRYRIDDRQHIEVRRWLRRIAPPLGIVGVYHSHPNADARPSVADRAEAHYPEWVHAIVSLKNGREHIGLFEIVRGRARRLRV